MEIEEAIFYQFSQKSCSGVNECLFHSWGLFEKFLLPATFYLHIFSILAEKHGYNIPEVTAAPNEANWLSEDGVKLLNNCRDDKMSPDFAKFVICRNM